jgi:NAD(P)-dependent dehydrogenase (short-subunit alcohol dehydrogenase family)
VNRLIDTVAVVAGGTGNVGEGIVRSFLHEGATVVVPWRNEHKRDRLQSYVADIDSGTLHCIPASVSDPVSMAAFRTHLHDEFGRVDLAVACLGRWYYGYSLHHMPDEHWDRVIRDNLTTHFLCLRALLSMMHERNSGTYVMVNGGAAELIAPETGVNSIAAAAQLMTARVMKQEAHGTNIRVHSLIAYNPIKTRDRRAEVVDEWLTPEQVGEYIARLYNREVPNLNKTIHRLYTRESVQP